MIIQGSLSFNLRENIKTEVFSVFDPAGKGWLIMPQLSYNLSNNADFSAALNIYLNSEKNMRSEFYGAATEFVAFIKAVF